METEGNITVVTSRESYVNEWTGFLEKWALLCPAAWVSLKAEPETKVVCLGNAGSLLESVVPGRRGEGKATETKGKPA